MRNMFLESILTISIVCWASPCLADGSQSVTQSGTESGTQSSTESLPFMTGPTTGPTAGSAANQAIQNAPHLSSGAKHVDVTTNQNGTVVVRGSVPTSGDRQKINQAIENTGATDVHNEVKVESLANKNTSKTPKARIITRKTY
jgi:osmotically-inducible protein OsmY